MLYLEEVSKSCKKIQKVEKLNCQMKERVLLTRGKNTRKLLPNDAYGRECKGSNNVHCLCPSSLHLFLMS